VEASSFVVRRANLDDLPALKGLWEIARLPVMDLEKRLTEVQVVTRPDGILQGAIALRMAGNQGLVHSESFFRPDQAQVLRPLLWERLMVWARNHGLARLWSQERSEFWQTAGFTLATATELPKLPTVFGNAQGHWLTIRLVEEDLLRGDLAKEFQLYQLAEKERTDRISRQVKVLKWLAALIALGFGGAAVLLLINILSRAQKTRK
jgi:N-acetylglutamate synthase-like GNAT family acetyltransferase